MAELTTYPTHDISPLGSRPFEQAIGARAPGDLVQHVDDHEALGSVVASSREGWVAVVWARSPVLDRAEITKRKVQHYITSLTRNLIGQPNSNKLSSYIRNKVTAGMGALKHQGTINDYDVVVSPSPDTEGQIRINVQYTSPFPSFGYVTLQLIVEP